MPTFSLHREQFIKQEAEEIWDFFCDPKNLAAITPAYMNFRITSAPHNGGLREGQIITYKVSPILGIPLFWMTEITQVDHLRSFTDEQKKGPYELWRHKHSFVQQADGVLMMDDVTYELPFGAVGTLAHALFIKRQLNGIFDFRYKAIENMFNKER